MATEAIPSEIIEGQRRKLLEILQQDPDSVLDTLTSRRLISEKEYEALDKVTDPLKKSRKLLILVQKKGEGSCQDFLRCLSSTFPESAAACDFQHEFLQHETIAPLSMGVSKNSEDTFFPGKKKPENPEITMFTNEKEQLNLETFKFFRNKETALSTKDNEKECDTPKVTLPYPVEKVKYEIPATITYLKDGQRYEEPDDSLYLGKEDYQEPIRYPEDAEMTGKEGDYDDPDHIVYDGEEDLDYSETTALSDEEHNYDDSEISISLEEEEEKEEKNMEERKKVFKDVLSCLNIDRSRKILPDFVKQFSLDQGCGWTPEIPGDLAWNFLMKIQALDVTARDSILRHRVPDEDNKDELLTGMENLGIQDIQAINPLDVLCASMLCSDSSLQREVMSNMFQCQFALPLLLPDAENNKIILMLGAMKGIVKKQSTQSSGRPTGDTEKFLTLMKMPVISFVRLGYCSFSKSRILNTLLNPTQLESHKIFLHHDLSDLVLPRQISDGLVEITWCFPDSVDLKESCNFFQKPVAVANLRGDLENFWIQFGFLMEVSSAVFFFTDYIGEKEWNLLMFLGEAAIERCYFVLSPQARKSEEAQIFQRILKLKPSQLLFWEGEEAEDRRKNMKALQTALQEVMASSFRCVSMEDMAFQARELGIQVDQDFETTQGVQVFHSENMARTAEDEGQQKHSQTKSLSESPAQMPVREPGDRYEVSQNFHHSPVFLPHQENCSLPTITRGKFNSVSLKATWVMASHFGSEHRGKWFCPLPFQNSRAHTWGKSFDIKYFQPQRFYSGERFMKFSKTPWRHNLHGTFGRTPRSTSQHFGACSERPQTMEALTRSGVSQLGHIHFLGSQLERAVRTPQPGHAQTQGTQLTEATRKLMRTSHFRHPYSQSFQSAGAIQKLVRPTSHKEAQLMTQDKPSDSAFQTGFHSMSRSKPSSQFKSHQPMGSQVNHFQSKLSQPVPSQPKPPHLQCSQVKPSPSKPPYPQIFQAKSSSSKPPHQQSSQAKPSSSKSSHSQCSQAELFSSKPPHPQSSQAKLSPSKFVQPRPCQPQNTQSKSTKSKLNQQKSCQANPSQAKAYHPRAGPKRGKH
ncbi:caspase recruitment domain-containing protein 6 [Castor canadensis]|uniref:Caspase recruitment domain-containing protein 6 n=1 Tax=Castor canadensis TaxID=51338 RepID=A0A8B7VQJ5_CASCN